MAGLDRVTGKPLEGWPHVAQSIRVILSTPIGTRVMRRTFGSWIPYLVDAPSTQDTLTRVFVAAATALDIWEPRFILQRVTVINAVPGHLEIDIDGLEILDGHLSRGAEMRPLRVRVPIGAAA